MKLSWKKVEEAYDFVRRYFDVTRLHPASSLSRDSRAAVHLKLETDLPTASFKVRGALFALHAEMGRRKLSEVVAASTGNHGAAVAYAAKLLGVSATVFLPLGANPVKRARIQQIGATIIERGNDIDGAAQHAKEYACEHRGFVLDDANNPDVPAGTATIGCEIVRQLREVESIWVPMGDTALIRGIAYAAKHLRSSVRVIGVQAERAPAYALSWKRGEPVNTRSCDTIADGLATKTPLAANVRMIRELVNDIRLVSEEQMLQAIRHLWTDEQVVAEPAGAATTAAWLASAGLKADSPAVLVVSGANISDEIRSQTIPVL